MKTNSTRQQIHTALLACENKKAEDVAVLQMDKNASFTDYFVIASGSNPRQIQAISDEVEERLAQAGLRPTHTEGYQQAEWVLLDYVDFVVHVFSPSARKFYDLERLWKSAKRLTASELASPKRAAKASGKKKSAAPRKRASVRTRSKKRTRRAS
jgi:ribosome-associated protein